MNKPAVTAVMLVGCLLAGCATPTGPVEVTRFSVPEIASTPRGAIAIEPAFGGSGQDLEFRSYAAAVSQELARLGYGERPDAPVVAVIDLRREVYRPDRARSPVSVGLGGSTGGWGSGVGLGLGFNLSGPPKDQVETQLAVTIRDRASGRSIWEGKARFTVRADSPLANTPLGAAKMAQALFQGFPGQSGETILVK
ncbi:MAG: DUF4136 domain-containing protein [Novosphingobium sp.]